MIDPWILVLSLVTVAATLWMGFRSARTSKSAADFFVAGRSVSVGWNASAISGEYLSAASFMGVAGMVMSSGYDALWYPVCYACGYLFLLLFIAGPLRRFGAYTIPDFAEGRYDSPVFRKIAVVFVLFIGFFYTMPQMKGAGTTLAYVFKDIDFFGQKGLPYWVGVVVVGAVITLNVALGGMKGITLIQAFQYWIKMFAISVPIFVLASVYGGYGGQLNKNGEPSGKMALESRSPLPAKAPPDSTWLNPFGPLTTKAAKAALSRKPTDAELIARDPELASQMQALGQTVYADHLLGLLARVQDAFKKASPPNWRTIVKPGSSNVMAYMPAPLVVYSAAVGRPMVWQTNLTAIGSFLMDVSHTDATTDAEFASQIARQLATEGVALVESSNGVMLALNSSELQSLRAAPPAPSEASIRPYALLYTYSLIIALVCGTAGLPHILVRFYTNPDGVAAKRTTMWVMILIGIFYVFPPVFGVMGRNLMPGLYEGVGVNGTDGIVLKLPTVLGERFGPLGSILSGITCAGAFAAFMSTFSGLLVSMTGALAHDVYGRILRPQSTPAERMKMFKVAAVLIGGVAILLGTLVENFEINFMVGQAFAIAAASYFPLLFMSVWWRGMTTRGAATGMLTGGLLAVCAISLTSWTTFITTQAAKFKSLGRPEPDWFATLKPYSLTEFWAAHPLLRILGEQPALWAVPLAILLMIVVSKLTRHTIPADIREKMLVLHAPEALGLRQDYIRDHEGAH